MSKVKKSVLIITKKTPSKTKKEKKDDIFWSIVDAYENKQINKKEVYKRCLELNNGNEEDAKVDYVLVVNK